MSKDKYNSIKHVYKGRLKNVIPYNTTYPDMNEFGGKNNNIDKYKLSENASFMKAQTDDNEK